MKVRPVRPSFTLGTGLVFHTENGDVERKKWELEGEQRYGYCAGNSAANCPAELLIKRPDRKLHFRNEMQNIYQDHLNTLIHGL